MRTADKPRIGLIGIMQALYDEMIPGITETQAGYAADVARFGRAAGALAAWRRLRVGIFGYAMNDMGDIRVDENALLRALGPQISFLAPGDLWRGAQAVTADEVAAVLEFEDKNFEIDPRLSTDEREGHVRMQVASQHIVDDRRH